MKNKNIVDEVERLRQIADDASRQRDEYASRLVEAQGNIGKLIGERDHLADELRRIEQDTIAITHCADDPQEGSAEQRCVDAIKAAAKIRDIAHAAIEGLPPPAGNFVSHREVLLEEECSKLRALINEIKPMEAVEAALDATLSEVRRQGGMEYVFTEARGAGIAAARTIIGLVTTDDGTPVSELPRLTEDEAVKFIDNAPPMTPLTLNEKIDSLAGLIDLEWPNGYEDTKAIVFFVLMHARSILWTKPTREALGQRVREVWVEWAKAHPPAKPHHLIPWDQLDADGREVDMRIGEAIMAMCL